ncbi:MAG: response regulator [Flavobacterium sp.]|nr:response regulator [Flavobacterium sp.]
MQSEVKTLFYVDDDRDDLEFFQQAVENLGERVALFHLADELIAAIRNPPPVPSMIFLDLNMPNKNGFDLMQEIKESEAFRDLPLVIYSTASDSHTVERCRLLGASLYIRKPTSIAALQQALRQVLQIDWTSFRPDAKNFVV